MNTAVEVKNRYIYYANLYLPLSFFYKQDEDLEELINNFLGNKSDYVKLQSKIILKISSPKEYNPYEIEVIRSLLYDVGKKRLSVDLEVDNIVLDHVYID